MSTTYDLAIAARALALAAVECDDEAAMEAAVRQWIESADAKGEACAYAYRAAEAEAEFWAEEAERLRARAKRAKTAMARISECAEQLVLAAEHLGGPGVRVGPLRMQSGQGRVVVETPDALPERFVRVVREPARDEIARALKAGEEIPGAHLVPTRHVRGLS